VRYGKIDSKIQLDVTGFEFATFETYIECEAIFSHVARHITHPVQPLHRFFLFRLKSGERSIDDERRRHH
jgi:hypothetical protein